jgi:hypothetical protein
MRMLSLCLEQKYAKRWLSLCIVTYLIEYLGEFEFIFETVLGYVSGDQMGSFEEKKTKSKISRLGTFKQKVKSWYSVVRGLDVKGSFIDRFSFMPKFFLNSF